MKVVIQKYYLHIYNYFFYIAYACFMPFVGYWFSERGLSASQIGLIFSIGPLVGLIIQPVWGMLIDYFGMTRLILLVSTFLTPWIALCYKFIDSYFPLYILVSVFLAVFSSTIMPIVDAMTVRHAKLHSLSYGTIRVLGSISFGLAVTLLGIVYNHIGISKMFILYIATMMFVCFLTFFINDEEKVKKGKRKKQGLWKEIIPLIKEPSFLLFLIPVFMTSIGPQMNNAFFSVYIGSFGEEMASKLGILYAVATLTEIPFFIFSGWFLRKFGYVFTLSFVSLAGALRWLILSLEPPFAVILFNQLFSGITYALYISAGINYAYDISPEGMKTTAHSLFIVVYVNIAGIIASNVGGWLIELGGYTLLFQLASIMSFLGVIGFLGLGKFTSLSILNNKQ